jgi:hypothetical protein
MLARWLGCSDLDCAHDWATFNYQWYTYEKYDTFDLALFVPRGFPQVGLFTVSQYVADGG